MDKEKRNIAIVAETESKYLTNILDKKDVQQFKKLIPELKDTWRKKQMFRTETEMRFSVLSDNKYPTRAAKYWQSVREQNTHFENLMHLSFDARKNAVEIKKVEKKINLLHSQRTLDESYMTDFLQGLINEGEKLKAIKIENGWLEFDSLNDYELYTNNYSERGIREFYDIND